MTNNNSKPLQLWSVQDLASENLESVPSRYIRPEIDDKIVVTSAGIEVPVIDLSKLIGHDTHFFMEEFEKLDLACQERGFSRLLNHGIDEEALKKMIEDVPKFFDLPFEEKKQCTGENEGYGQALVFDEEQKLDWGDMLALRTQPDSVRNYKFWPAHPLTFRETTNKYSSEMERIKTILLGLMAKNLGIDSKKLMKMFNGGLQSMRINYYPPCPDPSKVLGISPHSDPTGITLLLQLNEVDGLQIRHDGQWIPIKILPNAIPVNIGDSFEMLTNGRYSSIEHRVVINKEKERLTVATFHQTNGSVPIGPLSELIHKGESAKYNTISYDMFEKLFFSRKLYGKSLLDRLKREN
ncbi:hypothetical protein Syun_027736 [Stephania yunnanensis]|uniref:Fe2OG dioxygenase domain-containing protein n=1 Tax=Stephania yunnanensis TaxID=152371 RepID=A0AAP0EII7_9MAGN